MNGMEIKNLKKVFLCGKFSNYSFLDIKNGNT